MGHNPSIEEILEICACLPVSLAAAAKGAKMMAIEKGAHVGNAWREYDVTRSHRILLGRYGRSHLGLMLSSEGWKKWCTQELEEDDDYFDRNLCYHLRGTGCTYLEHIILCNHLRFWQWLTLMAICWTCMWMDIMVFEPGRAEINSIEGHSRSLSGAIVRYLWSGMMFVFWAISGEPTLIMWTIVCFIFQASTIPFDLIRGHSLLTNAIIGLLVGFLMVLPLQTIMSRRAISTAAAECKNVYPRRDFDKPKTMVDYRFLLFFKMMSRGKCASKCSKTTLI